MQERRGTCKISSESVIPVAVRFATYTLAVFLVTFSLQFLVQHGDIVVFKENGPVEWLQFAVLVATSLILIARCSGISAFREMFLLLASILAFAAIRELDSLLDKVIPWIGWKIGFVILLFAVGVASAYPTKLKWQIGQFFSSSAFAAIWAGFIVAVPVVQLFRHGPFLESLLGEDYDRSYKRVIEESGELVGYLLILAGSIESVLQMKAAQFRQPAQSETIKASNK